MIIGFKPGITSALEVMYTWLDTIPLSGKSFYRLRAVALDGTIVVSRIYSIGPDENPRAVFEM